MELRVLYATAHRFTWYGHWGYEHGRGAFNISKTTWRATLTNVHNVPVAALLEDFRTHTSDTAILEIIDRYQVRRLVQATMLPACKLLIRAWGGGGSTISGDRAILKIVDLYHVHRTYQVVPYPRKVRRLTW